MTRFLPRALVALTMLTATGASAADDGPLKLNDIQVLGSHNSFKRRIPAPVMALIRQHAPTTAETLDYYHVPLTDQLDRGVRQLEIDVFADPAGGRYAHPMGERAAKHAGLSTGFDRAAMTAPGFKVFHVPDVDYLSHCPTLVGCLTQIDRWSRAHPRHLPLMITINAADRPMDKPGITDPLALTAPLLDALDAEIRSVLAPERMIVPDDVRGGRSTLREAVLAGGWPTLDAARGKIFFVFDVPDDVSTRYRAGHPSLTGRAMFGFFADTEAEAATIIVQDPLVDGERIRNWVKAGYIVRTRSDADTAEARTGSHAKADAAAASGAQAISTDYYPGAPDPLTLRYTVTLPGGVTARCNPVRVTRACRLDEK